MIRLVLLAIALMAVWLIWSGLFKPLLIGLGLVSVAVTLWLVHRMDLTNKAYFTLDLIPSMLGFWTWLLFEIVRSNLTVAGIILKRKMPISPTMTTLEPPTSGLVGQAMLANSITLTPGTLTVDAHQGKLQVHCLTKKGASDLVDGDMAERVAKAVGTR